MTTQPLTLAWIYDEDGQNITPAKGKDLVRCAGALSGGAAGGPTPTNAAPEYGLTGTQPLTPAFVADMMRNPCRVGVYVLAAIDGAGQTVQDLDVKISDNSEVTRDAIARTAISGYGRFGPTAGRTEESPAASRSQILRDFWESMNFVKLGPPGSANTAGSDL